MNFFFSPLYQTFSLRRSHRGFSLIELMIGIFILSIISAIAIPSYQASIRKGYRTEAMAALEEMSQTMERYYSENLTYLGAAAGGANTGTPANTLYSNAIVPRANDAIPAYRLTIQTATLNSYTLRATPENRQLKDPCGILTINHLGARTAAGSGGCW